MEKFGLQKIKFLGNSNSCKSDENTSSSFNSHTPSIDSHAIYSSDVIIEVGPTTHTSGSSAVASNNITKYPWEQAYIPGNLVAVHSSENFIAYAIKAPNSKNGMVRIICRSSGIRGLIKDITGLVKDLSFAYLTTRILLGFIDNFGNLYVYEVFEEDDTLRTERLLEIQTGATEKASEHQRAIWCPYIPDPPSDDEVQEEGEDEQVAYLIVATNGPVAIIWNVLAVCQVYETGILDISSTVPTGTSYCYMLDDHSASIIDAAFSPDGTALATASLDGFVKFYQICDSEDEVSPRCLHQWNPHDGQPLSCLFFLDNHRNPSPDVQLWQYAVTGACNNSELKVWSCATWQCNQIITFESDDETDMKAPTMKAAIDPSSKYLLLSDIHRRVLYVMILCQDSVPTDASLANGRTSEDNRKIGKIISVTELPIQYPAISLTITSAEWKSYKRWKHEHLMQVYGDEDDEGTDSMDVVEGLVMKCVLINTQFLQDVVLRIQPTLEDSFDYKTYFGSPNLNISSSQDSVLLRDGLTDLSLNISSAMGDTDPQNQSSEYNKECAGGASAIKLISFPSKSNALVVADLDAATPTATPPLPGSSLISKSSEPPTMNLLTPESFSSPGRVEENQMDLLGMEDKNTPTQDLKSVTLSLLKVCRSSVEESSNSEKSIHTILDTVVSGSSLSPPLVSLSPRDKGDAPLATSEKTLDGPQIGGTSGGRMGLASSTSSPSLEVQEILHSHGSKSEEAFEDEMGENGNSEEATGLLIDLPHPPSYSSASHFLPPAPPSASLPHPVAPPHPLPFQPLFISSASVGDNRMTSIVSPNSEILARLKSLPQGVELDTAHKGIVQSAEGLSHADYKELLDNFKKSQEDVGMLRQLILSCDSDQEERMRAVLDLTRNLSSQLEKSSKAISQLTKNIEDLRKAQNKLQEQIPYLVATNAKPKLENAVRQEVKSALTQAVTKYMDPVRSQLSSEMRNVVSNSEVHITDSLSKAIFSRPFADSLNASMSNALSAAVQTACRDSYNKIVMPGFNAVTQQIFAQLNESFTRGTKEYIHHVENELKSTRTTCIDSVNGSARNLDASANAITSQTSTLVESLQKSLQQQTGLSESLSERLKHVVHDETMKALQEHYSTMEARAASRTQTPAPSTSHTPTNPKVAQQQVQQLLTQGQFNLAFKQALSASDLSLVIFVCERINPQQLFSQNPCPLTQDVLLSLVNQLSHDLSTFTDLKTKYLEESIIHLDVNHPVTREHMRIVLQGLQRSLTNHLALNPNHKKLKMLLLAVNHLVAA